MQEISSHFTSEVFYLNATCFISLSKKLDPQCSALVGYRYRFECDLHKQNTWLRLVLYMCFLSYSLLWGG